MPVRPLSPELAEKARLELNETPKKLEEGIQHLREWLAKQPHLKARQDDQWLATFLRGCKFSLERAKEKLDLFYSIKTTAPDLFLIKHTDPKFMEIIEKGGLLPLFKSVEPDSPRVFLMRSGIYDPKEYSMNEIVSVAIALNGLALYLDDQLVVSGTLSVMDAGGITMAHFAQMTPQQTKKMAVFSQDATPMRMKGAHYINTPSFFEKIFNTFKFFLNEKFKNRLFIHKNFDELYKYIPKEILPAEYGGNGGTIKEITEYWKNLVIENSSWLEEESQFGTDESKRPGKPRTAEEMFGVDGSFRQLDFD